MSYKWTKPLLLSNKISLSSRIMPSPMEGIMTPLFCQAVNELNCFDYWITPFIPISSSIPSIKTIKKKLEPYLFNNKTVIVQLIGNNIINLRETVKNLAELQIKAVNLNFACPSKKVLSSKSGGYLLKYPEQIRAISEEIKNSVPNISLSLKIRSGFENSNEMPLILKELKKINPDFIIMHYRTVTEAYRKTNAQTERTVKAISILENIPLIANGDITSPQTALDLYGKSNCAGIAIGRALIKNPYILKSISLRIVNGIEYEDKDSQSVFTKKVFEILLKKPLLYSHGNFLELMKFIWGENDSFFLMLKNKDKKEILKLIPNLQNIINEKYK